MKVIERIVKQQGEPQENDLWLDDSTTSPVLKVKDKGEWKEVSGGISDEATSQPSDGMKANVVYNYGELEDDIEFVLANGKAGGSNHYFWTFNTVDDVPNVNFPDNITMWINGSEPDIEANTHYEVSVYDNVAIYVSCEYVPNDDGGEDDGGGEAK